MQPLRLAACCLVVALTGACDHTSTRACFGSTEFCESVFGRNRPPEASAGPDREVNTGETVQLDGTASFDPDGRVTSYSWTQSAGPTVALAGSSQAVAEFVAPEVDTVTILDFRLVVTDDRDASDADIVRITIRTAAATALSHGVDLLERAYRPAAAGHACSRCWSYLGLWLAARVHAAEAGAEPDMDQLLDELRYLQLVEAADGPAATLPERQLRLFRLGQLAVAGFTAERDPATSLRARRLAAGTDPAHNDDWSRSLAAVYPVLSWADGSPAARRRATRTLLEARPGSIPAEVVAAATLILAMPAP